MIFRINRCTVDTTAFELRRDGEVVAVQPQVFDLLVLLLENADRVVTKDEIFERIWKNRIVSDATLSSRIKAIRQALGDDGTAQDLVRTVRRRGFRIVAPVEEVVEKVAAPEPAPQTAPPPPVQEFVGREDELALLQGALKEACAGNRQAVFVSGEPGIGKSTLVRTSSPRRPRRCMPPSPMPSASSSMATASPICRSSTPCSGWAPRSAPTSSRVT